MFRVFYIFNSGICLYFALEKSMPDRVLLCRAVFAELIKSKQTNQDNEETFICSSFSVFCFNS
jgi:hypothetical protein